MTLKSSTRTTVWLGDYGKPTDEDLRMDIHTEDDMVAIETTTLSGDTLEVFIMPSLFARIRQVMDVIEARGQ